MGLEISSRLCRQVSTTSICRPTPIIVLATMAVIRVDVEYSPQSTEPSIPSPISTPPMNVSTIEGCDTTYTTTDDNTFYSSGNEPRRVYWDFSSSDTFDSNEPRNVSVASSPSSTPPPPRRQRRKLSIGMSFPKKIWVAAHLPGMRRTLTAKKDPLMLRRNSNILLLLLNFRYNSTMYFNCCAHIRIRIYTYL